jgi:glutathione S-transferase
MYELYIGNKNYSSWSLRAWVLMTAHGLPFEEHLVRFEGVSNWDRFRAFSPNGRVPCLRDGERVVWDSLSIAEYLAERHAGLWPADAAARAWARSAAAEMHSGFAT